MNKEFKIGDRIWVQDGLGWDSGRIWEVLPDGTYLVRKKRFLSDVVRKFPQELEKRTKGRLWMKLHS